MNETVAAALSTSLSYSVTTLLVTAGVAAECNLLRRLLTEGRERRPDRSQVQAEASPVPAENVDRATSRAPGRDGPSRVLLAAAAFCVALSQRSFAQQSSPFTQLSPNAQSTQGQAQVPTGVALTVELPIVISDSAPLVISTDRPSFSDTAGIAPVGHLQLETGYTFTFRSRDGVESQRHNGPELLARIGLLDDRLEFRAATSGYTWSRTDSGTGSGFSTSEGFSDVALGVKLKLTDQDGALPRLAFEGVTTVAIGSRDISSRRPEPTLKLIWSHDLERVFGDDGKGLGVYGNLILAYPTTSGERSLQGAASICGTYALTDKLGFFVEYYVVGPAAKGTGAAHSIDFGTTYLLGDRIQLDARVGFGLNRAADNLFAGLGISFVF